MTEFVSSKDFVGFVIEKDSSVVGAMFAHRKTWWTNDEIFIDELFIKPALQKQGLGKALLQHGESYCKSKGLAGLTLLTNRGMPSQAFYENNGFTFAEHVIYFYKEV